METDTETELETGMEKMMEMETVWERTERLTLESD